MRIFFLLISIFILAGCASATPQSDRLLSQTLKIPAEVKIENVPFVEQSANYCGPATLSMALQWAGRPVSLQEVAPQLYTPGLHGTLQADMITASRRQGMIAVPLEGMENLLREVAAGHPVIVFENLSVSWLPQWHYAIVFGYDLPAQKIWMHSGPEAFKKWDLRKFERSWSLGQYWGLVVLPPEKTAITVDEGAHVRAAAALEQLGNLSAAEVSYQQILKRWPQSLGSQVGLANIAYAKRDLHRAAAFLLQATQQHPQSAEAWHNLAIAQGALQRKSEARKAAEKALDLASPQEKPTYAKNLKVWLD